MCWQHLSSCFTMPIYHFSVQLALNSPSTNTEAGHNKTKKKGAGEKKTSRVKTVVTPMPHITIYFHICDNKALLHNTWYTLTHRANPYSYSTKSYRNRWEWISVCCLTNGTSYSWCLLKALGNTVQSLALLYGESLGCFLCLYIYSYIFIKLNCLSASAFTNYFNIAAEKILN